MPSSKTPETTSEQQTDGGRTTETESSSTPTPPAAPPVPDDPAPGGTNEPAAVPAETTTEPDSFDRTYVEGLRSESAGHRQRARDAETERDTLRRELWTYRVTATGLLADPEDLPYDADLGDDAEAIAEAARALITRKPHMARSGTSGPLPDAHSSEPSTGAVSWGSMLRAGA